MFKRRKFKMTFMKTYQALGFGSWKEVTDGYLMFVLLKLQEKYDFEIISTSFMDCFRNSNIVIRCNKCDKQKIFMEYAMKLSGEIREVSF